MKKHLDYCMKKIKIKKNMKYNRVIHSLDISGETSKTQIQMRTHLENLGKVHTDSRVLNTESFIASDGHTVLARHGHHTTSIIAHNTLEIKQHQSIKIESL